MPGSNGFTRDYGNMAYEALCLCLTLAIYFAAKYGDEFTRYRFKKNNDQYADAYAEFCEIYATIASY